MNPNLPKFTSEQARAAGKKSKRKSWNKIINDCTEKIKEKYDIDDPDEAYILAICEKAFKEKDMQALKEYAERRWGKAVQKNVNENTNIITPTEIIIKSDDA